MSKEHNKGKESEEEVILTLLNNTLENMKYLRESSNHVSPESFFPHLREVVDLIAKQPMALQVIKERQKKFYDIQSAVETSIFLDKKLKLPDSSDEEVVFIFGLLKYFTLVYNRYSIFDAIYPYREKTPEELEDEEKRIQQSIWETTQEEEEYDRLQKLRRKRMQEKNRKSSSTNFINEVLIPFIRMIERELMKAKLELETKRATGVHINIEGNVGDHTVIGNFENSKSTINSHNQSNSTDNPDES
ncbi:hypothetical protein [Laceyella putida]|uniref:Uncharacterized protein n=1 Tax=Laceyella putida TaxID=110101 RepID=A0ABW2RF65_9BACL|nr:hypothetical protein [Candidatus Jettenia sp.]